MTAPNPNPPALPDALDSAAFAPNDKEQRALWLFVSSDQTRRGLSVLWTYGDETGSTYVATDGHTEVCRRSGTHRALSLAAIAALTPRAIVNVYGHPVVSLDPTVPPPRWEMVLRAPAGGKIADAYSINPHYLARVGEVEEAAGARAADDYVVPSGRSKKDVAKARSNLKLAQCARWQIPSDPIEGWYWRIETAAALWEGVIMPRRP